MHAYYSSALFLLLTVFAAYFSSTLSRIGKRERGLPPGPPTLPVLGNLLSFPREYVYLKYAQKTPHVFLFLEYDQTG